MSETATPDQAVVDDLARLHCATSRTFGVCLACPKGSWVPGHGTKATEWFENPDLGRYGLCAKHAMEWAEPAACVCGDPACEAWFDDHRGEAEGA